jgi:hypothetical protein
MGLACLKGAGWQSRNSACLWILGLAGVGGAAQQNRDGVCVAPRLGRP